MQKIIIGLFVILSMLQIPQIANAHSGGTNSYGCHNNYQNSYQGYHCHSGTNNTTSYDLIYQGQVIGRYPSYSQCQNAVYYVQREYSAYGAFCRSS